MKNTIVCGVVRKSLKKSMKNIMVFVKNVTGLKKTNWMKNFSFKKHN